MQEQRRKIEEQSLKNSVLDSAAAARFSTAAALEAAREKGIAGRSCSPHAAASVALWYCTWALNRIAHLTNGALHLQ